MEFKEFTLHPGLQKGIADAEYITCMPVQEQVLTHAFSGQDLYVQSQTGTGKTAAFLVVIFQRLLTENPLAGKKALIMAPTRELAVQIEEEAKMLAKHLPLRIGSFYGGVGYAQQEKMLRDNVQIMVGTPGRVLDLNKSGKMNLMEIAFLVLDEADRMFDMGFYPDLRKLIKVVPPADRRQTMLFSATLNSWVKNLAWEYTRSPFEIEIKPEIVTVEEVDQILYHVPSEEKMKLLLGILRREQPESAIVFCNTKRYTEIVAKRLRINGYHCEFIIGDLPQSKRSRVIDDVKSGKTKLLVATDVAARGLDIEGLAMVINYDLPVESENYVHRIGRTARAGKTGRAITLASEQDVYELPAIERYIGKKIPSEIAAAEFHGEDASAGQYIHSEAAALPYEDRGTSRSGKGHHLHGSAKAGRRFSSGKGGTHAHGQNRGDRNHAGKKNKSQWGKPGHRQGNVTSAGKGPKQDSFNQDASYPAVNHDAVDLSLLSAAMPFEERMALYKQKYNTGSGHPGESRQEKGKQNPPQQSAGTRTRGKKPSTKNAKADTQRKKQTDKQAPPQEQDNQAAIQTTPVKKGIFSRLLGLLRKTDDKQ